MVAKIQLRHMGRNYIFLASTDVFEAEDWGRGNTEINQNRQLMVCQSHSASPVVCGGGRCLPCPVVRLSSDLSLRLHGIIIP